MKEAAPTLKAFALGKLGRLGGGTRELLRALKSCVGSQAVGGGFSHANVLARSRAGGQGRRPAHHHSIYTQSYTFWGGNGCILVYRGSVKVFKERICLYNTIKTWTFFKNLQDFIHRTTRKKETLKYTRNAVGLMSIIESIWHSVKIFFIYLQKNTWQNPILAL